MYKQAYERGDVEIIGPIMRLQVQPTSIKVKRGREQYEPGTLQRVETLRVDARGVVGVTKSGEQIMDIHHRDYPHSHYRRGNSLSLCFTSHYRRLQSLFGPHLFDGSAGENLLVQTDRSYSFEEVEAGFALYHRATGRWSEFGAVRVATPCEPFARYALNKRLLPVPAAQMKATLQELDHGRRGFYVTVVVERGQPVTIQTGDLLLRRCHAPYVVE